MCVAPYSFVAQVQGAGSHPPCRVCVAMATPGAMEHGSCQLCGMRLVGHNSATASARKRKGRDKAPFLPGVRSTVKPHTRPTCYVKSGWYVCAAARTRGGRVAASLRLSGHLPGPLAAEREKMCCTWSPLHSQAMCLAPLPPLSVRAKRKSGGFERWRELWTRCAASVGIRQKRTMKSTETKRHTHMPITTWRVGRRGST